MVIPWIIGAAIWICFHVEASCPVLSEIAAHPASDDPEWMELAEVTGNPLRLHGWSLDDGSAKGVLDSAAFLPKNGRLVLSPDCAKLRLQFGSSSIPCSQPSRWNRLSIESDWVVLRDSTGKICDSVAWNRKTWGDWPSGRSLERLDLGRSGNDPANWVATSNPLGGTPGWTANPMLEPRGSRIHLEVRSRRVLPGYRSATIQIHAPWDLQLSAELFDLSRRKIATVFDGQIPASGLLEWNGASGRGFVAPGTYLLLLEFKTGKSVQARFREWLVVEK